MTRIIWKMIKDKLILPYLDVEPGVLRPGIEHRDATDDQVTIDAAKAIKQHNVGVKCATITPTRPASRSSAQEDVEVAQRHHPQHPGGTIFREPIIKNVPRLVPGLDPADHHRPPRLRRPVPRHRLQGGARPGTVTLIKFTRTAGADGPRWSASPKTAAPSPWDVQLDESIQDFARPRFSYASTELPGVPVDQEHHPQGL